MSDEEHYFKYSEAVHKLIVLINGGLIGFLQLRNNAANSLFDAYRISILSFWVFIFLYALLRVSEIVFPAKKLRMLFGHSSHLFGALASLFLVSVMSPVFALCLLPLLLLWFSVAAYVSFRQLIMNSPLDPPNSPPV